MPALFQGCGKPSRNVMVFYSYEFAQRVLWLVAKAMFCCYL